MTGPRAQDGRSPWLLHRRAVLAGLTAAVGLIGTACAADPVGPVELLRADLWRLADGRRVRLASVVVPDLPAALPVAARALVSPLTDGRVLQLAGSQRRDRYGRLLGTLIDQDGNDPRAWLLRAGLAVVRFTDEPVQDLALLLEEERAGRQAGRGIWGELDQAAVPAADAGQRIGRFALVEGVPVSVDHRFEATYLDFGEDWRTSFGIRIMKRDRKRFVAAGLDPASLVGKRLRARGWPFALSGPMLELRDPMELDLVS